MQAAAIILAGGKNSRMARNKALMQIGKQSIIERIIVQIGPLVEKIFVVTNNPDEYALLGVEVVNDIIPGCGPLSGVHAGLLASPFHYNLVIACDMPFVSRELGEILLVSAVGHDASVFLFASRPQPLFAVYTRNCFQAIEKLLLEGNNKCTAIYPYIDVSYLDVVSVMPGIDLEQVFFNVNTPVDFEQAKERAINNSGEENEK